MFTVYALVDPRDSAVRYIGVTKDLKQRFNVHIANTSAENLQKKHWITELKHAGLQPILHSIETVLTKEDALDRELYWIGHYLKKGCSLLNIQGATRLLSEDDVIGAHLTYRHAYTRCGKERCRKCREGEGHGPYLYAYWSEKGKTRSRYIGKATDVQPDQMRIERYWVKQDNGTYRGMWGSPEGKEAIEISIARWLADAMQRCEPGEEFSVVIAIEPLERNVRHQESR